MPRPLRPIDDGLVYHVINRGNNQQQVFFSEGDCFAFLKALAELKARKPFELYGYCLMKNHFHLLMRPLGTSVSRIMQSLLVSHTQRYHKYRGSGGHVWQGRFKSPIVQDDNHLLCVLRYIEANPVKADIVPRAGYFRWSSFLSHGLGKPNGLLDKIVAYEQLAPTPVLRQKRWDAYVHQEPEEAELIAIRRSVETGLPFGENTWVENLCANLKLDLSTRPRGRPRKA
jgi:putative transposase